MPIIDWARLTFWTLVCGTLAAGSANAINQYLERDIDNLMARTRRRPLPANAVTPERAVVFGIALGATEVHCGRCAGAATTWCARYSRPHSTGCAASEGER